MAEAMQPDRDEHRLNRRTALILASVALAFFVGVIARRLLLGG
jgi:hypothetical protein